MSEAKFTTIVFQHESDSLIIQDMLKAFAENEGSYADARITAVSKEDEISRVELLETGHLLQSLPEFSHTSIEGFFDGLTDAKKKE